jgi:hypothetical protein
MSKVDRNRRVRIVISAKIRKGAILTANLSSRDDLPTPEFPIRRTLKR